MKRIMVGALGALGVFVVFAIFDLLTGFETNFEAGWFGAWAYAYIVYEMVPKASKLET